MKKLTFLLLMFLIVANGYTQDGWFMQDANTDAPLSDVFFVNDSIGWIVGLCPILKTVDGGNTWMESDTSLGENFSSIFFIDDSTGWIAGGNGKIIHTENAGISWIEQYSNDLYPLLSVYFVTKKIGFACGTSRRVIKTTDGGNNWEILDTDPYQPGAYHTIFFVDSLTGWVAGEQSHIYKTTDSGKNWKLYNLNRVLDEDIYSIKFIDDTTGFAAAGWYPWSGIILKTINGGETWALVDSLEDELYSCSFGSDSVGWAVGRYSTIRKTVNGGDTWEKHDSGYELPILQSVFFLNDNVGWIVSSDGQILKTTTGGVTSIEQFVMHKFLPEQNLLVRNFPNPFNTSTSIEVSLLRPTKITVKIYDLTGRLIDSIYNGSLSKGKHSFTWNAAKLSSGLYISNIEVIMSNSSHERNVITHKMLLLK